VTGSSDGIGLETARQLVAAGHRVVLHGRSQRRADHAMESVPGAAGVAVGDLSVVAGIQMTAGSANVLGPYDAVIHNAGIYVLPTRQVARGGGERVFTINVLAAYLLTALMPLRLGQHPGGRGHPGVAGHQRRAGGAAERPAYQAAGRGEGQPGRLRRGPAGGPAHRVRRADRD
jgi:NAD(P)-dependent dehydrogenase (short-subunit alcohol dehydrogenase family)